MLSNFCPSQCRTGLENGPICDHEWLNNGSKPWFSQNDPSLVVVPKQMNTAHFEPLIADFQMEVQHLRHPLLAAIVDSLIHTLYRSP